MSSKNNVKSVASAPRRSAYVAADVDVDSKIASLAQLKKLAGETKNAGTVGGIGLFGGLFKSPGSNMLLVSSTDSVGSKLKIAALANNHRTIGQDLVNHCVNDILAQGAEPLFFLDYIGASRFDGAIFRDVTAGICRGCRENGCALLGGETTELPGLYPVGEYDLVGTVVGAVQKGREVLGASIRAGDILIGLASNGLHTSGYSVARRVLFDKLSFTAHDSIPGTRKTVGETLLAVHRSYLKPIKALLDRKFPIRGMAHITNGGLSGNLPRILPASCDAEIDRSAWEAPMIFKFLENQGRIERDEMYRIFNMGIGFVLVVRKTELTSAMTTLKRFDVSPVVIGRIRKGTGRVVYV